MIVTLEPKQAFQKNEDDTKAFRGIVDSALFKTGVHNAIAEFVLKGHPTTEELEGVRRFLDVLLNFGEKPEPHEPAAFMRSIASLKPQPKK
jgi:hypothetical protein